MQIEPVGLELTELYAPIPKRKKLKSEKYIIRHSNQKPKTNAGSHGIQQNRTSKKGFRLFK